MISLICGILKNDTNELIYTSFYLLCQGQGDGWHLRLWVDCERIGIHPQWFGGWWNIEVRILSQIKDVHACWGAWRVNDAGNLLFTQADMPVTLTLLPVQRGWVVWIPSIGSLPVWSCLGLANGEPCQGDQRGGEGNMTWGYLFSWFSPYDAS